MAGLFILGYALGYNAGEAYIVNIALEQGGITHTRRIEIGTANNVNAYWITNSNVVTESFYYRGYNTGWLDGFKAAENKGTP